MKVETTMVRESEVMYSNPLEMPAAIRDSEDAADFVRARIGKMSREHFYVICLDSRHRPIGAQVVSVGILTASLVHPREVFQLAVKNNAAAILIAHNHPSGDATPSNEDKSVTKRLVAAGEIMGIRVIDHIIVTEHGYTSFSELGLLRD